jgi:putative ABC transport system ATP-binding protein
MSMPLIETKDANLVLMSGDAPLHILRDINLTVDVAEVVAIVGPSGSGKTSLLMVLAGLERATGGTVTVTGQDLSGLNEDQLAVFRRNNLGILFQNFHLVPSLTALENVSLALEIAETGMSAKEIRETAVAVLEEVGLGDRLAHLPGTLSGGEQQRVGLARAMVTKPRLMLADEPTGNLDQDTGAHIIELMFKLARQQQTAMILITHDTALAERADRTFAMDHGQLLLQEEAVNA